MNKRGEEPAAIDWAAFKCEVAQTMDQATTAAMATKSQQRPLVIVEGFLLYAEPLFRTFDRAVFLLADRQTCRKRRLETKPVPPRYFDELLWPCFVQYNRHLLAWKEAGPANNPLGDILVLNTCDGVSQQQQQQLAETVATFIRGLPVPGRDITAETALLRSVFS